MGQIYTKRIDMDKGMEMDKLPPEIITHILQYLSVKERKNKSLVNRTWYNASLDPKLIKKDVFVFNCIENDEYSKSKYEKSVTVPIALQEFTNTVMKSKGRFLNLKFTHALCMDCMEKTTPCLFKKRGLDVKSLYLTHFGEFNKPLRNSYLNLILSQCRNLETLSIYGYILNMQAYNPNNALLQLKCLHFCWYNNSVSYTCFNILMKYAPNLESLCMDSVDDPLLGPDNVDRTKITVDELITSLNVIKYLKTAQKLTTLKLDILYKVFVDLPENIKLKVLQINCFKLRNVGHEDFIIFDERLGTHLSLEELDIANISCCMLSAILNLINLKRLTIRCICKHYCDEFKVCVQTFLNALSGMKQIKELSIEHGSSYDKDLFEIPDCTFSLLKSFHGDVTNILDIVNYGQNLSKLTITNGEILSTSELSLIFNCLHQLKYLQINKCANFKNNTLSMLNLKGLRTLKICNGNFSSQCLQSLKHPELEELHIDTITFYSPMHELYEVGEFDDTLEMFASSVPKLSKLSLYFLDLTCDHYSHDEESTYCKCLMSATKDELLSYKMHFKILEDIDIQYRRKYPFLLCEYCSRKRVHIRSIKHTCDKFNE